MVGCSGWFMVVAVGVLKAWTDQAALHALTKILLAIALGVMQKCVPRQAETLSS